MEKNKKYGFLDYDESGVEIPCIFIVYGLYITNIATKQMLIGYMMEYLIFECKCCYSWNDIEDRCTSIDEIYNWIKQKTEEIDNG
jgi:hypothetical protein